MRLLVWAVTFTVLVGGCAAGQQQPGMQQSVQAGGGPDSYSLLNPDLPQNQIDNGSSSSEASGSNLLITTSDENQLMSTLQLQYFVDVISSQRLIGTAEDNVIYEIDLNPGVNPNNYIQYLKSLSFVNSVEIDKPVDLAQ